MVVWAGVHWLAIHFGDDVAGLQAGFFGGAAGFDGFDHDAVGRAELLEQHVVIAALFLESDADGTTRNFSVGDELVVDADDGGGGQREADAFEAAAAGIDGGVDADNFAGHIDQRAAGISGVDGGVGLQEALELVADVGAIFGADDSGGDGGVQAEGAAEGEHPVADLYAVRISELGDGKIAVGVDLDHREIGVLVKADYVAIVFGGIAVEDDLNFGGLVDDVIVGEDETLFVDDHAGAEAAFGVGAFIGRLEKTIEEIFEGIAEAAFRFLAAFRLFHDLSGGNINDRGADLFRNGGKGIRKDHGIGQRKERGAGGALVVSGLGVAGDHGADHDAEAQGKDNEQGGENFAAAHPDVEFLKLDAHVKLLYSVPKANAAEAEKRRTLWMDGAGRERRQSSIALYGTRAGGVGCGCWGSKCGWGAGDWRRPG